MSIFKTVDETHRSCNIDAVMWEPADGMIEVKGWFVDRAIDRFNSSLPKENKND